MGRPLRAVYANSTYSTGVQEMSDSDINDLCSPLLLTQALTYTTTSGLYLTINGTTTGTVSRGIAYDTYNSSVGSHPITSNSSTSYDFRQNESVTSHAPLARPLQYAIVGAEVKLTEMSDQDILDNFMPAIVSTMVSGGQGAHYLGTAAGGAPSGGTWVVRGTINDTYYNSSNVYTTVPHLLWQRTTGTTPGTIRPVKQQKVDDETRIVEMAHSDITAITT